MCASTCNFLIAGTLTTKRYTTTFYSTETHMSHNFPYLTQTLTICCTPKQLADSSSMSSTLNAHPINTGPIINTKSWLPNIVTFISHARNISPTVPTLLYSDCNAFAFVHFKFLMTMAIIRPGKRSITTPDTWTTRAIKFSPVSCSSYILMNWWRKSYIPSST